jgi:DinB superfamily
MSATTVANTAMPIGIDSRVLNEGYGPGAWHGPDLKAALADVTGDLAFRRPAEGRHNIAEIALHHAYCARGVRGQLTGSPLESFVLDGEDWFSLSDDRRLSWTQVQSAVETEQQRLTDVIADIDARRLQSPLNAGDRFNLVLGITCHAVYHAGQVQLIKRLLSA